MGRFVGTGNLTATATGTSLSDSSFLNATDVRTESAEIQLDAAAGASLEIQDEDGNIMHILAAGNSYSVSPNTTQHNLPNIAELKVRAVSGTVTFRIGYWR